MSAGGARRGRRDNGLDASDFAVAGDVDPRVGEHLLDVLAAGGIAAYLQPSADLNPITRTTTFPARPTDRLFVDRAHLSVARDYMTRLADDAAGSSSAPRQGGGRPTPGGARPPGDGGPPGNPDVEAEWARIVAGFHRDVDPTAAPWPAAEGLDPTRAPDPPAAAGEGGTRRAGQRPEAGDPAERESRPDPEPVRRLPSATEISGISLDPRAGDGSLLDGLDTFGMDGAAGTDETYTPPPPPPLPRISKYAVTALVSLVFGAVLLMFPTLLPIDRFTGTMIGFTAIVGGFVTLVWRLRPGDDEDHDPDDGAVV